MMMMIMMIMMMMMLTMVMMMMIFQLRFCDFFLQIYINNHMKFYLKYNTQEGYVEIIYILEYLV